MIVFAALVIGGWAMYLMGRTHGYSEGKQDALSKVSRRHPFRSIIYDGYDK